MCLDKPMRDHVLLQAVARANDVLLADFKTKIGDAEKNYLDVGEGGDADKRLERVIYGRFSEPDARKAFRLLQGYLSPLGDSVAVARVARPHSNLQAACPIVRRRPERLRQQGRI